MKKYQYQILRYVHDQFTNEFGNVGIVLYSPEEKFLSCKIIYHFSRLSDFFGDINGHFLLKSLKHFEKSIAEVAIHLKEPQPTENISNDLGSITNYILPKDDSALILSDVVYGIDVQGEMALEELFERIVEKYNNESQAESPTDSYV